MKSGGEGAGRHRLSVEELVEAALAEDVRDGDRTTTWAVPSSARGEARVASRAGGLIAGRAPAGQAFRALSPEVQVDWEVEEGGTVEPGQVVAHVRGPLRPILTGERVALNFLCRLSGVATLTARYVAAVEGTGCRITDTRKTTPGWRGLEKAATAAGGAVNHRMGLHDMVLVKENHIRAAGGVREALEAVRDRAAGEGVSVEVEVTNMEELEAALERPPDRILLDNMAASALREAVRRVERTPGERPLLEASGGVDLGSVRAIAGTGVDFVSVGAITHSAPALDLSLLVEEA